MNKTFIIVLTVIVVFFVGTFWSRSLQNNNSTFVSSSGIHWHPTLSITIDGNVQEIPSNIGLIGGHSPIHTHDDEADVRETGGVEIGHKPLHLEFNSAVKTDNVRLSVFFKTWGKTFNSQCILDYCIDNGTLEMFVNGESNTDFDNYIMGDNDRIEIVYTSNNTTPTSADDAPEGGIHNLPVPDAVAAVRTRVANELGINYGLVIVMTAYEKTWTNGCLNLAEIDEACTEALVPGWEVVVQAQGKEFVYHTNHNGTVLRQKI